MKNLLRAGVCLCLLLGPSCLAQPELLEPVNQLELKGQFQDAAALLTKALASKALPEAQRRLLEFELDRLARIRKDFPLSQEQLLGKLKESVRELTAQEFEQWLSQGRFDSRLLDGKRFFMVSSVPNLFFRYPELNERRQPPKDSAARDRRHLDACLAIKRAALEEKSPYVLPHRFQVTMRVAANADAAPEGQTVRAWLPVPRQYPFQKDFQLLACSSAIQHLAPPSSPIRSFYLEGLAHKGQPTAFKIDYAYTAFGVWFDLNPDLVVATAVSTNEELQAFTREAPHVVFTPELRALSQQISGSETNACRKAKRFYDWIAEHIQYSYSIEYCTVRNLSDYCRSHSYGDCGQEAMLFITLCRLNGIPARWQSGWSTFPGDKTIHDWSEIYLAPYGWMPVDPYMGIYAMRYATSLAPEQRREVRDFYFGGLDQYRMIANSEHCQALEPPKQGLRSDTVDFQRGELEWGNHNLYFDQYSYELSFIELKVPAAK